MHEMDVVPAKAKAEEPTTAVEGTNQEKTPALTRNPWNYHAAAALLARSAIVKVEDAD